MPFQSRCFGHDKGTTPASLTLPGFVGGKQPVQPVECGPDQTERWILLGRGVRLWDGGEGVEDRYDIEAVSSPSGVTHLTFTRR